MDHDHFLIYSASGEQKQLILQLFTKILQQPDTPNALITVIVHGNPFTTLKAPTSMSLSINLSIPNEKYGDNALVTEE